MAVEKFTRYTASRALATTSPEDFLFSAVGGNGRRQVYVGPRRLYTAHWPRNGSFVLCRPQGDQRSLQFRCRPTPAGTHGQSPGQSESSPSQLLDMGALKNVSESNAR
jgi:hypothetical protein